MDYIKEQKNFKLYLKTFLKYKYKKVSKNCIQYSIDNKDHKFQIINIHNNIESLDLKNNKFGNNILHLIFLNNDNIIHDKPNKNIYYLNNDNFKDKLFNILPKYKEYCDEQIIDLESLKGKDLAEEQKDPNSNFNQSVKKISMKLANHNLTVTWFILSLLVFFPIFMFFAGFFLSGSAVFNIIQVSLQAINRDFLVAGHQWWRIWTFIYSFGIINLVFFGYFLYVMLKYSELILKKWQILLTIFLGLPLLSILFSFATPNITISGPIAILCLLYGQVIKQTYYTNDLRGYVVRSRTILAPIFLVLFPLFTNNYFSYLIIIISTFIGWSFAIVYNNNWKKFEIEQIIPVFTFSACIFIPIILYSINKFVPPVNTYFVSILQYYYNNKLISGNFVNNIFHNYYNLSNFSNYFIF